MTAKRSLQTAFYLGVALSLGCHGHVVRSAPNHSGAPFDFSHHPKCAPAARPEEPPGPGEVEVRYLGAAGLYLQWGEDSILLGPYFSNPGLLRVLLGAWRADDCAIQRGLAGIDVSNVEAVFAGHSHYDHIGDLPVVLRMADRARVFVNRSGVHALAPYAAGRSMALEDHANDWVWLTGKGGERRPIRFRAVLSDHAPQVDHYLWQGGELKDEDWKGPWTAHRFRDLKAGQPFALVIDLMAGDLKTVRYRIYYQDSANSWRTGEPPLFDGRPYDLAVLCIASYDKAPGQPESILNRLRPRHVLVTHYDDFFRPQNRPVRFAGLLTEAKVDRYLRKICEVLDCGGVSTAPVDPVCGPSGPRWTMPLPGEWMRFPVNSEPLPGSTPVP